MYVIHCMNSVLELYRYHILQLIPISNILIYFLYRFSNKPMLNIQPILESVTDLYFCDQDTRYVLCGLRSQRATPWVYWQEERKRHFHTFVPRYSLIQLEPNLLQSCPPARGVYIPTLKEITPTISEMLVAKVSIFSVCKKKKKIFFRVFTHLQ